MPVPQPPLPPPHPLPAQNVFAVLYNFLPQRPDEIDLKYAVQARTSKLCHILINDRFQSRLQGDCSGRERQGLVARRVALRPRRRRLLPLVVRDAAAARGEGLAGGAGRPAARHRDRRTHQPAQRSGDQRLIEATVCFSRF